MAKETMEVVELLFAIGEGAAFALEDGEPSMSDAVFFFEALRKIGPAVSDISKVPGEISAWTNADTIDLENAAHNFDIPQDNIEAAVKDAIDLAGPLIKFLAHFKRGA